MKSPIGDHSYTLVPSHDLDLMSIRELPWRAKALWGIIYRCILLSSQKAIRGRMHPRAFLASLKLAALLPLIRMGAMADPIETATGAMIELERRLGIRSTIFVMPFSNRPGFKADGVPAPRNRACYYDASAHAQWLRALARDGWEIGVHGIDSHRDPEAARAEKQTIENAVGREVVGLRMHWLYHCGDLTYNALRHAGYMYDATFGWNDKVGWPEDKRQPYRRYNGLWVLPLNIQDGALLKDDRIGPRPSEAIAQVKRILAEARASQGVVTLLWHNNSFAPPRCWGEFYEWIVQQAQADGARIMTAREAIEDCRAQAEVG